MSRASTYWRHSRRKDKPGDDDAIWPTLLRALRLSRHFLDRDLVRVERQMARYLGHGREGRLVGPDRVFDALAVGVDAEIIRIALVGAVGGALGAGEQRHIGVPARHILHGRIAP